MPHALAYEVMGFALAFLIAEGVRHPRTRRLLLQISIAAGFTLTFYVWIRMVMEIPYGLR